MNRISHWIDGQVVEGTSGRYERGVGTRRRARSRRGSTSPPSEEVDHAVAVAKAAFPAWRATNLSRRAEVMFHLRELISANRKEIASLLSAEHGKVLVGRARRGRPRARERRVRVRHPEPDEGRLQRAGVDGCRRVLDQAAARRRRRHHAVQLPGDGPDVDVRQRARVRQHVRAQAEREGPVGVAVPRRAAEAGGSPRRLLQRRAGRQGRGRPAARAPRHRGDQLRRVDADREVHLRDRHAQRQARAGARRREEPHARPARRRPRHGRRRRGQRRVRLGGRAVHGDQRRARGRHRRRRARRQDQGAHPVDQGRPGERARQRDGPADHRRAPRQGRRLRRGRARRGRDGRGRRPGRTRRAAASSSTRASSTTPSRA